MVLFVLALGKQNMERQERNINKAYPDAIVIKETYTGTKLEGRKDFEHLIKVLQKGDTLIFDSVSRMSRKSDEGCKLYEELFNRGVEIVFLKEPQVDTAVYRQALEKQIKLQIDTGSKATDEFINAIIDALNKYTMNLAFEQIKKCFDQAEKEVQDLHQRTKEGMETARLNGKRIGQPKGAKLVTRKSVESKEQIIKYSKDFQGTLDDAECMKLVGVARGTYYKYKRELKADNNL